jgi:hypothetical protein
MMGGQAARTLTIICLIAVSSATSCSSGCGLELLRAPPSQQDEFATVPAGCSGAVRTTKEILRSSSSSPSRGGVLWLAMIGDSILQGEFRWLVSGLIEKAAIESPVDVGMAPAGSFAARARVDGKKFADDRHNCDKSDTAQCFIQGSKQLYYYVPRIACCSSASKAPSCALYRLMPLDWQQVPSVIRDHTQGTEAARAANHVCVSFIFMRTPADIVDTSTVFVRAQLPPTAIVFNPALHPMTPVLHFTNEHFKGKTLTGRVFCGI